MTNSYGMKLMVVLGFCLFALLSQTSLDAQRTSDTSVAEVVGIVDLHTDLFSSVRIAINTEASVHNQLEAFQASVKDGELILDYSLKDPKFKKEQLDHTYYTTLELFGGRSPLFIRPDQVYGDIGVLAGSSGERQLIVSGLMEQEIQMTDTLQIILTVEHSYDLGESILCSEGQPEWKIQQKIPFIMGAVGGAGLIAIGAVLEADARSTYDEYVRETDSSIGEDLYNDANNTHKWATGLMIGGASIIAADVVWYFVRRKRYKRQKYLYDTYCRASSMRLEPHYETGNLALGRTNNIGLTFTYTFE